MIAVQEQSVDEFIVENELMPMSDMIELGLSRGYSRMELNCAIRNYLYGAIDLTADFIPGEPK